MLNKNIKEYKESLKTKELRIRELNAELKQLLPSNKIKDDINQKLQLCSIAGSNKKLQMAYIDLSNEVYNAEQIRLHKEENELIIKDQNKIINENNALENSLGILIAKSNQLNLQKIGYENYISNVEKNINAKEKSMLLLECTLTKTNIRNGEFKDAIPMDQCFNQKLSNLVKQYQNNGKIHKARSLSENPTAAVTARLHEIISTTVINTNSTANKHHRPTQTMSSKKHLVKC